MQGREETSRNRQVCRCIAVGSIGNLACALSFDFALEFVAAACSYRRAYVRGFVCEFTFRGCRCFLCDLCASAVILRRSFSWERQSPDWRSAPHSQNAPATSPQLCPGVNISTLPQCHRCRSHDRRASRASSSLHSLVGRISNPQSPHPRKRRDLMLPCPRNAKNIFHRKSPHHQRIPDQRPMAPPRHRLGTHDRRSLVARELLQTLQPRQKLLRLHIIRISAKTSIVPTHIPRVRLRTPQPAQLFQMHIPNPRRPQMPRQRLPIKLRIAPRTRNTPHIHHAPHPMRPQQFNKFHQRPRRMSNRKNSRPHFFPPQVHLGVLRIKSFSAFSAFPLPSLCKIL